MHTINFHSASICDNAKAVTSLTRTAKKKENTKNIRGRNRTYKFCVIILFLVAPALRIGKFAGKKTWATTFCDNRIRKKELCKCKITFFSEGESKNKKLELYRSGRMSSSSLYILCRDWNGSINPRRVHWHFTLRLINFKNLSDSRKMFIQLSRIFHSSLYLRDGTINPRHLKQCSLRFGFHATRGGELTEIIFMDYILYVSSLSACWCM